MENKQEKNNFKRIIRAYRDLLGILASEAPVMVVSVFIVAFALGLMDFLSVVVNRHIFDDGIALAQGKITFEMYLPYVIMYILLAIIPGLLYHVYIYGFVESRSLLILRTAFKSRMLQKLKQMKYEHLESEASLEIIDKAYNRAENSARHLFPMYVVNFITYLTAVTGNLIYMGSIKWWLVFTFLIPAVAELLYSSRQNYNIYAEMEKY